MLNYQRVAYVQIRFSDYAWACVLCIQPNVNVAHMEINLSTLRKAVPQFFFAKLLYTLW